MRWFKGNLHCHSYWSDGRAFPDQAIRDYRDAGFDFCALTDHNRLEQGRDEWRKVEAEETGWPPTVSRKNFDFYRAGFPDAEWRERDGATEVRLQTPAELIERYAARSGSGGSRQARAKISQAAAIGAPHICVL